MSTGSTDNQTLSFLKRRFEQIGIRPNTRHGQNFMIDMNLQRILLDAADLNEHDVVLEVGTGTASLTIHMARRAAAVVTVEVDRLLAQLASEELYDYSNVTLLKQDALRNKNHMSPELMETVKEQLEAGPDRVFKLAANLPYNIATPVISNMLSSENIPQVMAVTIQKELADRIMAKPSTKDYSALSIWMQCQCRTEIVRILPPTAFWPRPKVTSAILRIEFDPSLRQRIVDIEFFHKFVRAMFFHRRKFLRSVVASAFKNQIEKPEVDAILNKMGFAADARAEQLDIETMIALAEAFRQRFEEKGDKSN